jgi:hypothetical protein
MSGSGNGGGGGGGGGGSGCLDGSDGGTGDGGPLVCSGSGARFVTDVVSLCLGANPDSMPGALPGPAAGPPKGGGCCSGSTDVLPLGNGGSIIVAFQSNGIVDGPGADFIVFENPFDVGGDPQKPFVELATVAVSDDGATWLSFPCVATMPPYGSCAGWRTVNANVDTNQIDPLDPQLAGGDPFDLADVGVKQARFVRITDRPDMPSDFDLDAVGIVNARCP